MIIVQCPYHLRVLTTLEQQRRLKPVPASNLPLRTPRARQIPPKDNIRITQGAFENYTSTSQNPHFLRGTLYFSSFFLKDFVKIFLLARFEKILMTFQHYTRW